MDEIILLTILVVGCFVTAAGFVFWMYVGHHHQLKAYAGDERSAKRIILPFYQPFIRYSAILFALLGFCLCLLFSSDEIHFSRVLQYHSFLILTVYFLIPSFLLQSSASTNALVRTCYQLFPWWFGCTVFWCLSFVIDDVVSVIFFVIFLVSAVAAPIFVSVGILTKTLYSRVQVGSKSNRNTTELLVVFAVFFGLYLLLTLALSSSVEGNSSNNDDSTKHDTQLILDAVFCCFVFVTNQLFPFALFRTLIADTKFWRGLGKHNRGGISQDESLRESGIDVHRPTMELNVISSTFQVMMAENHDITVDFAYLQLDQLIGEGATAKVFRGKLKGKLVAIKLSTPPEITEEVLDVFVAEARIASSLTHRNIVQFLGICVRPPQIGMVFEFCEGGNLKSNLLKQAAHWKRPAAKMQACLDAARGIVCLHNYNYIHRDIKTENFFVGKKWIVKLGDFGEATSVRSRESSKTKRMTILGTVAYMAPELVNATRFYDQAIDVYALGTTFWEIWTGKDPYDNMTQFEIYEQVRSGKTLDFPQDAEVPQEMKALMTAMWHSEPAQRPRSKEVVEALERMQRSSSSEEEEEEETAEEEKGKRSSRGNAGNGRDRDRDKDGDVENGGGGDEGEDSRPSIVENPIFKPRE